MKVSCDLRALLLFALLVGPAASPLGARGQNPSGAASAGTITIEVGRTEIIPDVTSFQVSNSKVINVTPTADGGLIINGIAEGKSTITAQKKGAAGYVEYLILVSALDVERLLGTLREALGDIVGLQIQGRGNVVELMGSVIERDDGRRIDRQLELGGVAILDLTTRNYLRADVDLLREELGRHGYGHIDASARKNEENENYLFLSGTLNSDAEKTKVLEIAGRFFEEDFVIERLSINTPQIEVDLETYSLTSTNDRAIGNNQILGNLTNIWSQGLIVKTGGLLTEAPDQFGDLFAGEKAFKTIGDPIFIFGEGFETQIDWNNNDDLVTDAVHQHVSVRSGDEAIIENKEERHIKVEGFSDSTLVQVDAGRVFKITPIVLENRKFETAVSSEVSTFGNAALAGEDVAVAKDTRTATSKYISSHGETIVIGGTRFRTTGTNIDSTPYLSRVPLLNFFFRRDVKRDNEIIQLFFMTLHAPTIMAGRQDKQSDRSRDEKGAIMHELNSMSSHHNRLRRWESGTWDIPVLEDMVPNYSYWNTDTNGLEAGKYSGDADMQEPQQQPYGVPRFKTLIDEGSAEEASQE